MSEITCPKSEISNQLRAFCRRGLLSDDFNEHAFATSSVEFTVENLFPRPEIQFAFGDRDNDFPAHDLTFEMGVGVVLPGSVMSIGRRRCVRR